MSQLRVAIYARHSTDKQNPLSSEDQAAACMGLVERMGGEVVGTYADPEVSGYRRDRPGLMRLLADAREGRVDVIVCEALDRIARDGEDISWIGKKLRYDRVRLVTSAEGEIDEIKLAVAGLLGSMFLSNLRHKTFRGMKAAVLAGRLAGGRAYGYRRAASGPDGQPGAMTIHEGEAETVRWLHREFANGRSSIALATELNHRGVPGPRGGQWNASTIRGDPRKQVGILNNPLYRGSIVWGRREWRKDPDSDRRERRYRLRDRSEWIEVAVPDLAIVDSEVAADVDREMAARRKAPGERTNGKRERHLFSGLIKCGRCGSNYTIASKDGYRCAGAKERGTCDSRTTVRVRPLEDGVLAALQKELLTADLAEMFVAEFRRELVRIEKGRDDRNREAEARLKAIDAELDALSANLLSGVVGPTISRMIGEREAERERLLRDAVRPAASKAEIVAHPALLRRYEEKIGRLREALQDETIRGEAMMTLRTLVDSVTILDGNAGSSTEAEVVASPETLLRFAQNDEIRRRSGAGGHKDKHVVEGARRYSPEGTVAVVAGTGFDRCSRPRTAVVVAGAGFEPATFRL